MQVVIGTTGAVRFVYKDELSGLLDEGEATVRRASHVEHSSGGWFADLGPVGGPILGPYKLRQDALAAEVAWLEEHGTPEVK